MTLGPALPPALRGPAALRLAGWAARGEFRLPRCEGCGFISYPPAETCRRCLDDRLTWRPVDPRGTILTATRLTHSPETHYRRRLPIGIATVRLRAGPVVLAFMENGEGGAGAPGDAVRLAARLDAARRAVLVACTDAAAEREEPPMSNQQLAGRTVLITGAGGGIGRALVAGFHGAGARVLAGLRDPAAPGAGLADGVEPVALDVCDEASVAAAARHAGAVDILVNNAGVNFNDGLLAADSTAQAEREIAVNYLGPLRLIRAFAPAMRQRQSGIIVNLLTILAHVNLPMMGSYCASKAAALSLTQGVRAELAPWGVRVIGIFPGAVDTRMTADLPPPKLAPRAVADAVLAAIRDGVEDAYPGDMAASMRQRLDEDAKALELDLARMLPQTA